MKTRQKLYVAAAALLAVSMVGAGGFASIKGAAEAPTVTDECSQIGGEGAVTADIYGMALQSGDVGFGADGRYTTAESSLRRTYGGNLMGRGICVCAIYHKRTKPRYGYGGRRAFRGGYFSSSDVLRPKRRRRFRGKQHGQNDFLQLDENQLYVYSRRGNGMGSVLSPPPTMPRTKAWLPGCSKSPKWK